MERIDQSEILEWKSHRVTQALLDKLNSEATQTMEAWVAGAFKNDQRADASAQAQCRMARQIIELNAAQLNGEDDGTPIPEQRDAE